MAGHRKFSELRARMTPERRARNQAATKALVAELPLGELRQARHLTQVALAEALATSQAEISKVEHRTDVYVSTLRRYIEALGGQLDITARFPDGDVRITQFQELDDEPHRPTVPSGRVPVRRVE
jgi:hypothetical protein